MPRHAREKSYSGYYHVINRGIGKMILFEDESDFLKFLKILKHYRETEGYEISAYCLMENHFHLLMKSSGDLGSILKKIQVSYSEYYNKKYGHSGYLFQNRYKSVPIETEQSFLNVIKYIHDNPQKAELCRREDYPWSSYTDYSRGTDFVDTGVLLGLIAGAESFSEFSQREYVIKASEMENQVRLKDTDALEILREKLHVQNGTALQDMEKKDRDRAIILLIRNGLSARQIERLTGISRGVIARILERSIKIS